MRHHFALLVVVLFAAVPVSAQPAGGHRGDPVLAVIMDFDESYSPVSVGEMRHELEGILRACSLDVEWRVLDADTSKESFSNLIVARFKGKCRNEEDAGPPPASRALALTHVSEGEILPFSEVDCDRVRRFVQPQLSHTTQPHSERLLGKALGRVLAHELYHVIMKTRRHAERGLAKAVLTPQELLQGDLRFQDSERYSMRHALMRHEPVSHRASAAP